MLGKIVGSVMRGNVLLDLMKYTLEETKYAKLRTLADIGALKRPAHAYCLYWAADLAKRLGLKKISALEFGVAGGNTLKIIEAYAARIQDELGVEIEVYGFDTGEGLPDLEGEADLPHWFSKDQYKMNSEKLKKELVKARLVLGNVKDTVTTFFEEYKPAPIGALFMDLDYYSSTRDALKLLDADSRYFLPRLFMYFDDVIGSQLEMYGEYNGEMKAIREFNESHELRKIHLNRNLLPKHWVSYRYHIYYGHLFDHKEYNTYIGASEQEKLQTELKLS